MKIARTLLLVLGTTVVGVVVVAWAIGRIDLDDYRDAIDAKLTSAIGLDVVVAGDLHAQLLPLPHLEVERVSVANLPGRGETPLLQVRSVDLTVDLLQLLRGRVRIDHLRLEGVEIHVETDAEGNVRHENHLAEVADEKTSGPIDLQIRSIEIENAEIYYSNLENGQITTFSVARLELGNSDWGAPLLLTATGTARGGPFEITATGGSLPVLLNGGDPFPLSVTGELFGATVEITGSVRNTIPFEGYDLQFDTRLPDLAGLVPDPDGVLEHLGPIRVVGRIDEHEGKVRIRDLDAAIPEGGVLGGKLSGSVDDVHALTGVKLALEIEVGDPSAFASIVGRPLPEAASIAVAATISDNDGSLGLTGSINATASDGSWTLVADGEHDDLFENDEIEVALRLEAHDLAAIAEAFGTNTRLPSIGPLAATARLRDRQGAWSLSDIDLKLGTVGDLWAEAAGTIDDLLALQGVDLRLKLKAPKTHEFVAEFGSKIPAGGSLDSTAHLTDAHGTLGLKDVRIRNTHPGILDVEITGDLDDLRETDGIDFNARVSARELSVIGRLIGKELPAVGPFAYSGKIHGTNESARSTGSLSIARTTIDGDLSGAWPDRGRPRVQAKLRSKLVRLGDLGAYDWIDDTVDDATIRRDLDAVGRAFDALRRIDLDIAIAADQVTGRGNLDLARVGADIKLVSGNLQVRNARAAYATGNVEWSLDANASSPLPRVALQAALRGVNLTHLVSQFDPKTKEAGAADVSVRLQSSGNSIPELTRRLDGSVSARLRDGKIVSGYSQHFIRELSLVSMPDLLRRHEHRVECMLIDFALDAGQATVEKLSIDTEAVEISGAGRIDLVKGAYQLRLTPTSHDPSLLSITATVDVTGPLANPVFHAVPESIPISATRSLIMNSTRPVRRLLGAITPKSLHPPERTCPSPFDSSSAPVAVVR